MLLGAQVSVRTELGGLTGECEGREEQRVQRHSDGSTYEGETVNGLKHGEGVYTWKNGETYEGYFYKDFRHGEGVYSWPSGHKFIGKFYLNTSEGYGQYLFPNGTHFQGLYHIDQRLGPGVLTYPDGRQDVGLWHNQRLFQLCTTVEKGFSLRDFPQYAAYGNSAAAAAAAAAAEERVSWPDSKKRFLDDLYILPPMIERFSTNAAHLPLPPSRRRELDQQFYGDEWEADEIPYWGDQRDPLSYLTLEACMRANIQQHRRQERRQSWDVGAVLCLERRGFGPKGPLEVHSEGLIGLASTEDWWAVAELGRSGLVHPDVADARGYTALMAATVNCCKDVIDILMDIGADIDKLNGENMSALAVCHVLYYPNLSLHTAELQDTFPQERRPLKSVEESSLVDVQDDADRPKTTETLQTHSHVSSQGQVEVMKEGSPHCEGARALEVDPCTIASTERDPPEDQPEDLAEHLAEDQPEHRVEDRLRDKREDQPEYQPRYKPEDQPEHQPRAKLQDQPQDPTEDQPQDQPRAKLQDQPQDPTEDQPQDPTEDQPRAKLQDQPQDPTEDQLQDQSRAKLQDQPQDPTEDQSRAKLQNQPQDPTEDQPRAKLQDQAQDPTVDQPRDKPEDSTEDQPRDKPEDSTEDQPRDKPENQAVDSTEDKQDELHHETEDVISEGVESGPEAEDSMALHIHEEEITSVECTIQVRDGPVVIGSVQRKEYPAKGKKNGWNEEFESSRSVRSFHIHVKEKAMVQSAEALSCTGLTPRPETEETLHKMAAMKLQHRDCLGILKLLLERGADPNACQVPMSVLLMAVMASDVEAVRRLLLSGARTDIPLSTQHKGLYPLHVAAALLGSAGPEITQLLLHAITDPDARACDQTECFKPDQVNSDPVRAPGDTLERQGGTTALHVACRREVDFQNASRIVSLLLSHGARTDLLWSGHSPLSLAIASGNQMAVVELLKHGVDPNVPLGHGVGSALCALANNNYRACVNRPKLFHSLMEAGADILMPVLVDGLEGTAVDYAHYSFNQDMATTPLHKLSIHERAVYKERQQLLSIMAQALRQAALQRGADALIDGTRAEGSRGPLFQFCVSCGRSVSVKLTSCSRCHAVFFCSKACREGHKEVCIRPSAKSAPKVCSQRRAPDADQRKCPGGAKDGVKLLREVKAPHKANIPKVIQEHKADAVQGQPQENYSFI